MADSVVDASVFAAAYFRESREPEARRLIASQDVVAPTLVNYEMASIARRKLAADPQMRRLVSNGLGSSCNSTSNAWMWTSPKWLTCLC